MSRILIPIIFLLFFLPLPVFADEAPTNPAVVSVDAGIPMDNEALVDKANSMANSLHQMAMKLSVPLVVIIVIAGVALGIFLEAARKMALFAIIALVVIYWAPMLVNAVVSWVS
jgi:type III secretory pathway component EscT